MSYRPVAATALGYDVELDTPLGKRTVSFDLEKLSDDVTTQLVADGWPKIQQKAQAALPQLVSEAIVYARPEVDSQRKRLVKQGAVLVGLLAVAVIGAAWYVGRPASARRAFA